MLLSIVFWSFMMPEQQHCLADSLCQKWRLAVILMASYNYIWMRKPRIITRKILRNFIFSISCVLQIWIHSLFVTTATTDAVWGGAESCVEIVFVIIVVFDQCCVNTILICIILVRCTERVNYYPQWHICWRKVGNCSRINLNLYNASFVTVKYVVDALYLISHNASMY